MSMDYSVYLAKERLPHLWCPGCGHGIILKNLLISMAEMEIPREKALLACGIGCSGRAGDYVNFHRFQGTHGRTLAYVTGIKMANPELKTFCFMGDGDCSAIGIGHLIHAARRNVDVTAIVPNNLNYGMTGGQFSPLTPGESLTSTSRSGKAEPDMDLCRLAAEAGANYVARTTVYHVIEMKKRLIEATSNKGFSLVEVITPCPTYYGRYNQLGNAYEMIEWIKDKTVPLHKYEKMSAENQWQHFWRGKLVEKDKPDLYTRYWQHERGMDHRA